MHSCVDNIPEPQHVMKNILRQQAAEYDIELSTVLVGSQQGLRHQSQLIGFDQH